MKPMEKLKLLALSDEPEEQSVLDILTYKDARALLAMLGIAAMEQRALRDRLALIKSIVTDEALDPETKLGRLLVAALGEP